MRVSDLHDRALRHFARRAASQQRSSSVLRCVSSLRHFVPEASRPLRNETGRAGPEVLGRPQ